MKTYTVIGGGTGSYTVLRGLKQYCTNINAIVSMFDSGGSTGVLRDEFGHLPPGDVRRCLLALSNDGEQTKIIRDLFEYRFERGAGFRGHSFGNLLLTALTEIYGKEDLAINKMGSLMQINGKVIPVTLDNRHLCAQLADGHVIIGEKNIDVPKHDANITIEKAFLDAPATINPDAEKALKESDVIIIGPGDLYTSIIPNFLVKGMKKAITESKAKKVFIVNLMTKFGETNNFTAYDFVKTLEKYTGEGIIDTVICNNSVFHPETLHKYEKEKAYPVICDASRIDNIEVIEEDLIFDFSLIRHDPEKLARIIQGL